MTPRIVLIGTAALTVLGSATLRAQQPPAVSPPPPPQQIVTAPLLAPKQAPPPPSGAPVSATQRTIVPATVRPMKRESAPPDSVRPVAAARPVIRPLATQSPPPPAPLTTAARIAAANRTVAPARSAPIGATMQCKDGTYLTGAPSAGRCANNGGIAVIYPAQSSAPTARPQPQRKQP